MQIFLPRGHSSPDMPFRLIDLQDLPGLTGQQRIDPSQSLGHILMYRAFTDTEFLGGFPHGGVVLDDLVSHFHGPFFDLFMLVKMIAVHILLRDSCFYII